MIQPFAGAAPSKPGARSNIANDDGESQQAEKVGAGETALEGVPLFAKQRDNAGNDTGDANGKATFQSGIPKGLLARRTEKSAALERGINRELQRIGQPGTFRAVAVSTEGLPDALRRALGALRDATGIRPVVFRNLTPGVLDFQGVNFRDGSVYINENSQSPAIATAAHEWLHDLRKSNPALYRQLADEVRRQGAEARPSG